MGHKTTSDDEFLKSNFWAGRPFFSLTTLKNWTPVVKVKNWTLCGLITQKVRFPDLGKLPAE